jgi:hypothetical protein
MNVRCGNCEHFLGEPPNRRRGRCTVAPGRRVLARVDGRPCFAPRYGHPALPSSCVCPIQNSARRGRLCDQCGGIIK